MKNFSPLQPGIYYHIYNRGNNREDLFREEWNYPYFLQLYARYIEPIADTYAYCLLRNHFHLFVRIKTEEATAFPSSNNPDDPKIIQKKSFKPSKVFQTCSMHTRKPSTRSMAGREVCFEERFNRIEVTNESYLEHLVFYIHFNPQKHSFVDDFRDWPWSSYQALIFVGKIRLKRYEVIGIFGNAAAFEEFHRGMVDEKRISELIEFD